MKNAIFCVVYILMYSVQVCAKKDSTYIGAWGWGTIGRVESSYYDTTHSTRHADVDLDGKELFDIHGGITMQKFISDHTHVILQFGGCLCFPALKTETSNKSATIQKKKFSLYLMQSAWESRVLNQGILKLKIKAGYFSVKTNPQSQNLGEYLFRSGAYPQTLHSGFEIADKIKIFGVRFNVSLWDKFENQFYVISETEVFPLWDVSLAYIARFNPASFLDISAGVNAYHLISMNKKQTVPVNDQLNFGGIEKRLVLVVDNADSNTFEGDTTNLSFAGVKTMARIAFDPKYFLNIAEFGPSDLKIYAEIAVLGWRNYPVWYEKRWRRMPVMFGFVIPTFNIFDVLAVEAQWFGSPFVNSDESRWEFRSPTPYQGANIPTAPEFDNYRNKSKDNWKWSVYFSKKFDRYFRISGQIANDHSKRSMAGSYEDITQVTFSEKDNRTWYWPFQDWYWQFRFMFFF